MSSRAYLFWRVTSCVFRLLVFFYGGNFTVFSKLYQASVAATLPYIVSCRVEAPFRAFRLILRRGML